MFYGYKFDLYQGHIIKTYLDSSSSLFTRFCEKVKDIDQQNLASNVSSCHSPGAS